jgi:hypothetical protein
MANVLIADVVETLYRVASVSLMVPNASNVTFLNATKLSGLQDFVMHTGESVAIVLILDVITEPYRVASVSLTEPNGSNVTFLNATKMSGSQDFVLHTVGVCTSVRIRRQRDHQKIIIVRHHRQR